MGLFDMLKASTIEAGKMAKKYTNEAVNYAEKSYGKEEWYKTAKDMAEKTVDLTKEVSQIGKEIISDISDSEIGKQVGKSTRDFATIVSQLPVLSLTSDIIKSKNGINEIYPMIKNDSYNPEKYIWLAEAMRRVERDRKIYSGFRTVVHPSSIIFRETIKTAASMGIDNNDKFENRILRNAYYMSIKKFKTTKEAKYLHILARVYLLTGDIPESIKFCKMAIMKDSSNKLPFITLARAYLEIGQYQNSKKAAEIAISNNLLYAYDILSQLVILEESDDVAYKVERYSSLRDKIQKKDRQVYLGCAIDEVSIIETIGKEQMGKLNNVIGKTKTYLSEL